MLTMMILISCRDRSTLNVIQFGRVYNEYIIYTKQQTCLDSCSITKEHRDKSN